MPSLRSLALLTLTGMVLWAGGRTPLAAQEDTQLEGALFLLLPVGARAVGMARAMTATTGASSVWWNPAGLAGLGESRLDVFRGQDLAGDGTSITLLTSNERLGALGASYILHDFGTQEIRDREGNFLGTAANRNHVAMISAASEVLPSVSLGANFKIIQARITCRGDCPDAGVTGSAWAVDLGAQLREIGGLPLTLGAAVVHLGQDVQFVNEDQADPLPTRLRVGAAWDLARHWTDQPGLGAILSVELEDQWDDPGSPATYVGTELSAGVQDAVYLRAGYVFGADLQVDGAAVGVGVRYDRIDLAIARSLASSSLVADSDPVQISFGLVF